MLYHPDLEVDLSKAEDRVTKIINDNGGKITATDNWGKRKLAYEINKQLKGIYMYWQYLGTSGMVEEIERNLRLLDAVIRYYTVKVDENVDPSAKPTGLGDEAFTKAATTIPDEEALATGAATLPRFEEEEHGGMNDEFLAGSEDTKDKD